MHGNVNKMIIFEYLVHVQTLHHPVLMLVSAVRHTAQLTWHWEASAKAGGIVKFVQNYVCFTYCTLHMCNALLQIII